MAMRQPLATRGPWSAARRQARTIERSVSPVRAASSMSMTLPRAHVSNRTMGEFVPKAPKLPLHDKPREQIRQRSSGVLGQYRMIYQHTPSKSMQSNTSQLNQAVAEQYRLMPMQRASKPTDIGRITEKPKPRLAEEIVGSKQSGFRPAATGGGNLQFVPSMRTWKSSLFGPPLARAPTNYSTKTQFEMSKRILKSGPSVFNRFNDMAKEYNAINMAQGYVNLSPETLMNLLRADDVIKRTPEEQRAAQKTAEMKNAGGVALTSKGSETLRQAICKTYSKQYGMSSLDPEKEVVITSGATEAAFSCMQALINPGDEAIIFEPFYDAYPVQAEMAGGECKFVPLKEPEGSDRYDVANWKIDMDAFRKALSPKTKVIIFNNPHNPLGKVFTREEITEICDLIKTTNAIVVADEVYDQMVFTDACSEHVSIASLPDMFERTITLSSAGKRLSVDGWKIGWAVGPAELIEAVTLAHQWIPFSVSLTLQNTVQAALELTTDSHYLDRTREMFQRKRDHLIAGLDEAGLRAIHPEGCHFLLVDTSCISTEHGFDEMGVEEDGESRRDYRMCRFWSERIGVTPIPPSAFYSKQNAHMAGSWIRLAFCKPDEVINQACDRIANFMKKASAQQTAE